MNASSRLAERVRAVAHAGAALPVPRDWHPREPDPGPGSGRDSDDRVDTALARVCARVKSPHGRGPTAQADSEAA